LIRGHAIFLPLLLLFGVPAGGDDSGRTKAEQATQLCAAGRWQELSELAPAVSQRTADLDLCYGTALARLERWADADQALRASQRSWRKDKRFPTELAGVAFQRKRYSKAAAHLRDALKIDHGDAYANDFLGTVYFLEGNLEAALKYWNRVGKPQVADVGSDPLPRLDPVLLDRSFAFSPASTLQFSELRNSDARLRSLEVFRVHQFELQPRPDGKFDVLFRNWEKNGFGESKWVALLLLLRGLPAQSVYPEVFNLGHEAFNILSFYRWDKEKRRAQAYFSGPIARNPRRHFRLGFDLRNENWVVQPSFTGTRPSLGGLNLRREALQGSFTSIVSGRWQWSASAEFSHRDFRRTVPGPALTSSLLATGFQLKQTMELEVSLFRFPERRMTLSSRASAQTGRIWSQPGHGFEKLQSLVRWDWFPASSSDDYEIQQRVWAGKGFGAVSFDELSVLGIGGDNDLWMRGHIATRDGRKGSAPLGRNYFLSNWELDKNLHQFPLVAFKIGPFVDTGKITDPVPSLGSQKWLADVGAQIKVKAFGFGVVVSYGKDLRSGNNALCTSFAR
jgi:tetratricopeptide (TPR) repeat protein